VQVDGAPATRGALAEQRAQGQQGEGDDPHGGAAPAARGVRPPGRLPAGHAGFVRILQVHARAGAVRTGHGRIPGLGAPQQATTDEDRDDGQRHAHRGERQGQAHAGPGEQPAEQCTGQAAEAVIRVEGVDQRTPVLPFHAHGLGVHRDVHQAAGDAVDQQRHHELGQAPGKPERDRQQRDRDRPRHRGPGAAEPVDDPVRERGDEHQPDRPGEQGHAEQPVGQAQVLLDRRDPGQPHAVGQAEHDEVRRYSQARTPQTVRHGAGGGRGTGGGRGSDVPDNTRLTP
jgi:hypothetical protein